MAAVEREMAAVEREIAAVEREIAAGGDESGGAGDGCGEVRCVEFSAPGVHTLAAPGCMLRVRVIR